MKWKSTVILWTPSDQKPPTEEGRVSSFFLISLLPQLPLFPASPARRVRPKREGSRRERNWILLWCCRGHLALGPPGGGWYSNVNSYSPWSSHGLLSIPHAGGLHRHKNNSSSHRLPEAHTWRSFVRSVHYSGKSIFLRVCSQLPSASSRSGSWETTPLSIKLQLSPKAAGYFLPLEVSLESCPILSNSPNCRKCMSAPLIGSITFHIWLKMKDKHTLYTMKEGHKEHGHFHPKKSAWETLQPPVNPWHMLTMPEGGWRANVSSTHFSVFTVTEHLKSRQLRFMPKREEALEKRSNLKSNDMETTPSYLPTSSFLLFPAPVASRPMCNKMKNVTN